MTESCRQEEERGNRRVPPKERAEPQLWRQRAGGSWGKPGFPHEPEPKAREAAQWRSS